MRRSGRECLFYPIKGWVIKEEGNTVQIKNINFILLCALCVLCGLIFFTTESTEYSEILDKLVRKMSAPKKILETDLAKPICDYLVKQGYTVRSEVKDCDISALKDDELIIVELKRSLTIELLIQAVKRQKIADAVYLGVPKPKNLVFTRKWNDLAHLIRRLELGLIYVSFKGKETIVEIPIDPILFDRNRSRQRNANRRTTVIKEINNRHQDLNTGGSKGKKLVTAYREQAVFIACCLERLGPLSPKILREIGTDPKKTLTILSNNHYNWFTNISRGIYGLSEQGKTEIQIYSQLNNFYQIKINQYLEKTKPLVE